MNTLPVFAAGAEESKLPQSVESLSKELFGDLKIKSSEYLYNLDDSADFIYIDYEDYGYAVFLASTLELLEYSPKGSLPFFDTMEKKYYSGPANYFNKSGEYFFDIISKEAIYISKDELQSLSKQSLEIFSSSKEQSNYDLPVNQSDKSGGLGDENHMPEDPVDLDPADFPGTAGTTYIPNHAYFTSDPTHGFNQTGTCAAVASQLLLSYNNYYNDRRIIADNFLNGSNTTLTERNKHPNFSENPLSMTSETLGSRGASEDGSDDPNSYFSQVVNAIPASSSASDAEYGIRNILNARNNQIEGTIDFTVNSHMALFGLGTVSVNDVKNEINAGRPMYLSLRSANDRGHAVVAYGYQQMNSTDGYIAHFGWDSNYNRIWVNSSWCRGYVTLRINHTHNYTVDTGINHDGTHREVRCGDCGHRELLDLYNVTDSTITSPRYPLSGSITIPSTINGTTITDIGSSAFANQTQMSQISIPASVTSIGSNVFENCTSLTNVTLPNNLTSIGSSAFKGCTSLGSIVIPNTVTSIGSNTFENCSSLTNVTLPNNLVSVGDSAFKGCTSLTSITIPNSVTSLGDSVLSGCSSLTSIAIPFLGKSRTAIGNYAKFGYIFGESYYSLGSSTNQNGVTYYIPKNLAIVIITDVTNIPQDAFYNCSNLTNVTLPNILTNIGSSAFKGCTSLSSITIPNSVTSIGSSILNGCYKLTSITIPFVGKSRIATGSDAKFGYLFGESSYTLGISTDQNGITYYVPYDLTNVIITSETNIPQDAFYNCSDLTNITIPNTVASIGSNAFYNCSDLTNITIPNAVTSIGSSAFANCSRLTNITIPNSVTSIGSSAFTNCSSLTDITIPITVTSIGSNAFYNCSTLTDITIPNAVTSIGSSAFANCSSLTNITIPNSVTSIGSNAFYNCSSLTNITIPSSVKSIDTSVLSVRDIIKITKKDKVNFTN